MDIGVVGLDRHCLFQQLRAFVVPAARTVEIRKIDKSRNEVRVETQRRAIFFFGRGWVPPAQIQQPEIEVHLRPVGVHHLGGEKLRGGLDQGGLLLRRQPQ